jgi:hypothetical protein
MRGSPSILVAGIALLVCSAQAAAVEVVVDIVARTVQLDFANLPPYELIRLQGVTALDWCACLDPNNPSSMGSTGFTVNADNLEMQYEGAMPPSTNFIDYAYLDGYELVGFELVDWIVVTELSGDEVRLIADRPIFVPEPRLGTGLLCAFGLVFAGRARETRAARKTSGMLSTASGTNTRRWHDRRGLSPVTMRLIVIAA